MGLLAVLLALAYDRWDMAGLALFLVPLAMAWLTHEAVCGQRRRNASCNIRRHGA
jgi:hypothetical protein